MESKAEGNVMMFKIHDYAKVFNTSVWSTPAKSRVTMHN